MDERRYTDAEVEEILRSAASSHRGELQRAVPSGLTLAELADIGREVGIAPEQIVAAASRLDRRAVVAPRTSILGMPISVSRTIDLPRTPTDREWSILLGEVRELFGAQGRESSSGDTRSWRNGNLHIVVEPTETGYRLRMGTRKSDARPMIGFGFFFLAMAILLLFSFDGGSNEIVTSILFALLSAGTLSYNAIRLPRWAARRESQFELLAERMLGLLSQTSAGPGSTSHPAP